MNEPIEYQVDKASEAEIRMHLRSCESGFVPPLSDRVEIDAYSKKIVSKAMRFEAWADGRLIGLVAAYCNNEEDRVAYITSVSVLNECKGRGIAGHLIADCIQCVKALRFRRIRLEVERRNAAAIKLYEKNGFVVDDANVPFVIMSLQLQDGEQNGEPAGLQR